MAIPFKHLDTLRLFVEAAQHGSLTEAARALNMTKGAVSYQIKTLETDLGVAVFERNPRGVVLTAAGQNLLTKARPHFHAIEEEIATFREPHPQTLTVGMSSYFASRWLSPRLMTFMQAHPQIQLRIQPLTQLFDLARQGVDLAIRWGDGQWDDVEIEPFMAVPASPTGNAEAAERVQGMGLEAAFSGFTLLRDHDGSNAWSDWFRAAGLSPQTRMDTLIIPDPNVRVQAVIDGQGVALNDALVAREIDEGTLFRLSDVELENYGYFLAIPHKSNRTPSVDAFVAWLHGLRAIPV
ncbi:LysR family transcriptional regulator [Pikeienuella piscinae]|uniref:LysR family transcriptional regulator n=1 Tax=Pikeienuella piscinae TaxID=2748098 RepID=A0A7L5C2A6_9RHOB|nr:LysR substrate-binding domain-containing protein [Pikeienuella piscinae]QIE56666.1 LysR family transcriptional regulator [Pikeienuella piscinae]